MTTFVLVHGGLHGAWCWDRVLDPLLAAGHDAVRVDLHAHHGKGARPSIEDYVDAIEDAVDASAAPPVIVAHSLGGVAASQFAERRPEAVSRFVLVNALVLEDGEAALPKLQTVGEDCELTRPGALAFSPDGTAVAANPAAAADAFYNRCTPADAAWATAQLRPEYLAPLIEPLRITPGGFGSVDKVYLGSRADRVLPWAFQRQWSEACGAEMVVHNGDHSPFLSVPNEFVRTLMSVMV